jgi:tetratricopeptide (TPR) repeat protein
MGSAPTDFGRARTLGIVAKPTRHRDCRGFCNASRRMPGRMRSLAVALALAAATLAAYRGVLENDFVNYDDDLYITNVPAVQAGLTLEGVEWAFTSLHGANWFPLTRLSWMLDAELFGLSPRGFHATSLGLHVANVLLALVAVSRLTGSLGVGAFTAGVFALHPLHVESVAWAASRKDVLSGLFWMLALIAYERWARAGPSAWRGAAVLACLLLGLMAKPVLVALPAVLLLLDFWPLRRLQGPGGSGWDAGRVRRALLEKAPLFACAGLFAGLVLYAQGEGGALRPLEQFPLRVRLGNAVVASATYLRRAALPTDLAVFHPHPGDALTASRVAAAGTVLLLGSALAFWQRRRRPQLAVGWLWWLATLAPTLGILQVGQAGLADRYAYLAQSGLVLAIAATAAPLAARTRASRTLAALLAAGILLALGIGTAAQVRTWRDSETLFAHALRVTERNHVAHINLGLLLFERGELDPAASHLEQALAIAPASATAHGLLGNVRLAQGRNAEAVRQLETALRLEPASRRWMIALGSARLAMGQVPEAIAIWERALAQGSAPALLHAHLGRALASQGRLPEALERLDAAVALEPGSPELVAVRARLLDRAGRVPEAIDAYREALALGADAPDLRNNLAWRLATREPVDPQAAAEAVTLAEQAVAALGGDDANALDTLAAAYAAAGRDEAAVRAATRALAAAEAGGADELAVQLRGRLARYQERARGGAPGGPSAEQ